MKAVAVFPHTREIKLIDHQEPMITGPLQVKVRMLEVGVCGTDKDLCAFTFGSPPPGSEYFILGHESLGEVVEIGSQVSKVLPGDLVVMVVRHPCNESSCLPCRSGRQDLCASFAYTERGIQAAHGFMTEYIVDDEQFVYKVPPVLRDVAVLVEPLTIAEKGLERAWQIEDTFPWLQGLPPEQRGRGRNAVVLGAGPVGLLGMMMLVQAGYTTYVYSRSQTPNPKADLVAAVGATYVSTESIPVDQFVDRVGHIDIVYEAMGAGSVPLALLERLGPNGIFVFGGGPGHSERRHEELGRTLGHLIPKNQVVLGTVNASYQAFTDAIRDLEIFLQRWPDALPAMISGRYPLERYAELVSGNAGGIKNVLVIS